MRPHQGPGDLARGRPDRDRGEGDKPLGRTETEDQRRAVSERVQGCVILPLVYSRNLGILAGPCTATATCTCSTIPSPPWTLTWASTSSSAWSDPGGQFKRLQIAPEAKKDGPESQKQIQKEVRLMDRLGLQNSYCVFQMHAEKSHEKKVSMILVLLLHVHELI